MFKYKDINGARFIIRDKTLKFSRPDHFNDPFEFYDELVEFDITQSYFKKIVEKRTEDRNRIKVHMKIFEADKSDFIAELIQQFKRRKDSTKVSCFSNINQNILMWSHYAQNHTGVCIEFNEEILKRTFRGDSVIEPVRYRRKIKSLNFSKYQEKRFFIGS